MKNELECLRKEMFILKLRLISKIIIKFKDEFKGEDD